MREWIQSNTKIAAIVLIVVIAAAAAFAVKQLLVPPGRTITRAYYVDLKTGEQFVDAAAAPPVASPSGADQGVLAMVFSCGACAPEHRFVGWLENNSAEASQLLRAGQTPTPAQQEKIDAGRYLAAAPEKGAEPQWVSATTPAAAAIKRAVRDRCEKITMCTPDD